MRGVLIKFSKCVPLAAMATSLLVQPVLVMAQMDSTAERELNSMLAELEANPCVRNLSQSIKSLTNNGPPPQANDPRMQTHVAAFGQCMGMSGGELSALYAGFAEQLGLIHSEVAKMRSQPQRDHEGSESQLYSKDLHIAGKQPKSDNQNSALQSKDLLTAGQKPKTDDEILAKCAEVARKNAKVALQNPFAEGLEKRIEAVQNIHKDCTEMALDEFGKQMDGFGKDGPPAGAGNAASKSFTRVPFQPSGPQNTAPRSVENTVLMPDGKRYPKAAGGNPFQELLDAPPSKEKTLMEKTKEGFSNAYSNVKARLSGPAPAEADDDKPYEDTAPKKSVLQRMRDAIPNPFAPAKSNTVENDDDSPPQEPKKGGSLLDRLSDAMDKVTADPPPDED